MSWKSEIADVCGMNCVYEEEDPVKAAALFEAARRKRQAAV